jgi:hypothetical protein
MRPLRWKSRFQTGDAETDRQKRAFFECLNSLVIASGQREHCHEMEDFLGRNLAEAEQALLNPATRPDLGREFAAQLLGSLPLSPYGSPACRQCGLCDLAQRKVAEHLDVPAQCLLKDQTS